MYFTMLILTASYVGRGVVMNPAGAEHAGDGVDELAAKVANGSVDDVKRIAKPTRADSIAVAMGAAVPAPGWRRDATKYNST